MAKEKFNDDPLFSKPTIRIEKHYTEEEMNQLVARSIERELKDREDEGAVISLSGDIGRDNVPGPYFSWTITGKDPRELLRTNTFLLNKLKRKKRK